MKCQPVELGKSIPSSKRQCFLCIRNVEFSKKYDFAYECAYDIMEKMSMEEIQMLAEEVFQSVMNVFSDECDFDELILLGDCYARVYMYTLIRGGHLTGKFDKHDEVAETLRIAATKSLPAWGICQIMEKDTIDMPKCWLNMNAS